MSEIASLGSLQFESAAQHPELLAPVVFDAIAAYPQIGVAAIDPTLSDTAAFCAHYGIAIEQAANCIIIEGTRGETVTHAACVVLGNTRADVNGAVRRLLNARRASFAKMEDAVEKARMEYGAITPIGLPPTWRVLLDARVLAADAVIIGSGIRGSKLALSGKMLAQLPRVEVVEMLARPV
ncbi:MAG: hypothetical protein JO019_02120 [Candidatus Kaiserbacteria bacterium]|nr:hypothetical protein [Candidatus Kaiserbacteria bacterium]